MPHFDQNLLASTKIRSHRRTPMPPPVMQGHIQLPSQDRRSDDFRRGVPDDPNRDPSRIVAAIEHNAIRSVEN
jgi:hypothetical protein